MKQSNRTKLARGLYGSERDFMSKRVRQAYEDGLRDASDVDRMVAESGFGEKQIVEAMLLAGNETAERAVNYLREQGVDR